MPLLDPDASLLRHDYRAAALRLLAGKAGSKAAREQILAAAQITAYIFTEPGRVLDAHPFIRLLRASKVSLDDEFFGLTERRARQGTTAMMVDLALGCATLGAAIEQVVNFFRIIGDDLQIYCEQRDEDFLLGVRLAQPELDPHGFLPDFWLLYLQRFFSWATDLLLPVKAVACSTAVKRTDDPRLIAFIREDWCANQHSDALLISRKYWTLPIVRTRSEWLENVDRLVFQGIITWPDGNEQYASQVRALLLKALHLRTPPPRLQEIAQALCLTVQTLHRHLQHEGTGYQRLLDELRRDFAIDLLLRQHQSVAQVAHQLGFAEPRSFSRAFKQWTGQSPSDLRKS